MLAFFDQLFHANMQVSRSMVPDPTVSAPSDEQYRMAHFLLAIQRGVGTLRRYQSAKPPAADTIDTDDKKRMQYFLMAATTLYGQQLETDPENVRLPEYYLQVFVRKMSGRHSPVMAMTESCEETTYSYGSTPQSTSPRRATTTGSGSKREPLVMRVADETNHQSAIVQLTQWLAHYHTNIEDLREYCSMAHNVPGFWRAYNTLRLMDIRQNSPQRYTHRRRFAWIPTDRSEIDADDASHIVDPSLAICMIDPDGRPIIVADFNDHDMAHVFVTLAPGNRHWVIADQPPLGTPAKNKVYGADKTNPTHIMQEVWVMPGWLALPETGVSASVAEKRSTQYQDFMAIINQAPVVESFISRYTILNLTTPYDKDLFSAIQAHHILQSMGQFTAEHDKTKREFFSQLATTLGISTRLGSRTSGATAIQQAQKYFVLWLVSLIYRDGGMVITLPQGFNETTFLKMSQLWSELQFNVDHKGWHGPNADLRHKLNTTLQQLTDRLQRLVNPTPPPPHFEPELQWLTSTTLPRNEKNTCFC